MLEIVIAKRKIYKEEYTFILNIPSYSGEVGVCGIEIDPHITVKTPENCFGYEDTFIYDRLYKNGHFLWRSHTPYIKRKILEFCDKFYDKSLDKFYYGAYQNNGKYNKSLLENVEYN